MIIFGGFAVGLLYKVANISFKGWKDTSNFEFGAPLKVEARSGPRFRPSCWASATSSDRASQ
ncbi:hypothetical protein LP419_01025 [Massilia sp. H-1]|nr:hypothetical protein LP419_01025 [Massilia sp. H-1]